MSRTINDVDIANFHLKIKKKQTEQYHYDNNIKTAFNIIAQQNSFSFLF